jgi:hypothetical protein
MTRQARISSSVAASVAAAIALAAGAASARADTPKTVNAPAGATRSFTLTPEQASERVRFDQPSTLRLCNDTERTDTNVYPPAGANTEPATDRPVPLHDPTPVGLQVNYEDVNGNQTVLVDPAQCATFTAQEVTISPTQPLEGDATLQGTVTAAMEVPVYGQRMGPATKERISAMIAEIRHMIDQDDATERATTAEMNQARDALQQAAVELSSSPVAANAAVAVPARTEAAP